MIRNSHLVLHEASVPAATERSITLQGWLFLRVHRGEGYAFREKTPLLLSESDTLVQVPGRPCQLRASQLGELQVQFFQVFPELLTGTLTASERQQLEQAAQLAHTFPGHRPAASPFAQQFALLVALGQPANTSQTLLARCEMLRLAALILTDLLPSPAPHSAATLTAKDRFELLMTQTVESELQQQPVEELARRCGCGVRHFSRLFRSYFGRSLVTTRIELCLHKAKQLLEESDAKIIDVAMDSGFNQIGLFTSRFKKRFGCTPSEWRRRKAQPDKTAGQRPGRRIVSQRRALVAG